MAKASVAWKVRVYGDGGALSGEQIQRLAEDFAIDPELVKRLSEDLASALHPQKRPKSVSDVVLRPRKGAAQFEKAVKDMRLAEKKIKEARSNLDRIHVDDLLPNLVEEDPLIASRILMQAYVNVSGLRIILEKRVERLGQVRYRGELDQRKTRDDRRSRVCGGVFRTWERAGRKLSYTTDGTTSERGGPLIEFANAVVACVSEPPGSLKGETIRKELEAFKESQQLWEVYRSQKIENQDT